MAINFNVLIEEVAQSTTIEGSFLIFINEIIEELNKNFLLYPNSELENLLVELIKYKKQLATAIASNIAE